MKVLVSFLILLSGIGVYAVEASRSAQAFCQDRSNDGYLKELILKQENQLGFENMGGLFNGGVCWWHSRFLRNATYLTYYRPDLEGPKDAKEAKELVSQIIKGNQVVMIPGFKNLHRKKNEVSHQALEIDNRSTWNSWCCNSF